ncbi:MAG: patatin family protein [Anaerobutyricum sp.]|nr:patatin family protein [Eubacterium sp.]MDY6047306.1 patatin family protein [Anaerobutyricum sp.]
MYHAGLILEGGGMRGVYTAGVLDAFLEENIEFSSIYGVSAGSCHACSYMSKQKGRAYRVNVDYLDDPNYCGVKSYLKTGNVFGADMLYSQIPNVLDPFDYEEFEKYPGKFFAVLTNLETGEPEYIRVKDLKKQMWAVRASSSLPLVSKTLVVKGRHYLDGGIADSIPIRRSIEAGNEKNVVILTREDSYRKTPNELMPLMKLRYSHSKAFLEKAENRHIRYNETLDFLKKEEEEGRTFVIRPSEKVNVGRVEKNKDKLEHLYNIGLEDGRKSMEAMKKYLEQ